MVLSSPLKAVVLFACFQLSTAAPATGSHAFTVHRQATGRQTVRSAHHALTKAYRKFGVSIPESVLAAGIEGSVISTPTENDQEYLSPVQIGTPPRDVMLDFDTGSSDLWSFSGQLPATERSGHTVYAPLLSTSAERLQGQSWKIQYGDGSEAAGNVWADKVVVGPATVTRQAVEAATYISAEFAQDQNTDGILGLGGSGNNQVSPTKQTTFFRNLRPSLASPLFAAYLKPSTNGSYDFGFLNSAHYTGDVYYTPAYTSMGYWEIKTTGFSIGAKSYPSEALTSIVDTGTSIIFMSSAVIDSYYDTVASALYSPSVGGVVFACNEVLPDLSFNIGGSMRTVPGSYINYAPAGTLDGAEYCFGGLQPATGLPFNILGDVFLKSQYAVFDAGNNRVGFADQK